jgi:methylmalonyl-CoA/ethylmalonyl-CoA epimerase
MAPAAVGRIHHIDFVVRDLDRAIEQFRKVLGLDPGPRESLPSRGIDLARFRVGETWIILVQPTHDDSPVKEFLERHGEGYFHMGLEVDDAEAAAATLKERGVRLQNEEPRRGLEGWSLIDIDIDETSGAMMQLVETGDA